MIRLKDMYSFSKSEITGGSSGIDGLWSIFTDAGSIDGLWQEREAFKSSRTDKGSLSSVDAGGFTVRALEEIAPEGIMIRDDSILNRSDRPIHIYRAYSRFRLPEGEYEVYTQWNGALNESRGMWQELHTEVVVENLGIRATCDAAPMIAFYNKQDGCGLAFYLWGNCAWKIEAHNHSRSVLHQYTVDMGINEKGFNYELAPGAVLELPRIVVVPFTSKRDLDSNKLCSWFTRTYGAKRMPVIYNTWMAYFDHPDIEKQIRDAQLAGRLGAEYFVVDAGWFGHGQSWSRSVGEWVESADAGYMGRLMELVDAVHFAGMKFGLWFEIERAMEGVPAMREHPDWFYHNGMVGLLDFSDSDAAEYAFNTVDSMIRQYGIEYLKLDFNRDLSYDPSGRSFVEYHRGFASFVNRIREAHPGIYIEGCASGGYRMELYHAALFDSFWTSDNQSPYDETRICKDTMKRLPISCLEIIPTIRESSGFVTVSGTAEESKYIACHDSEWKTAVSVDEFWLKAQTVGTTLGLSIRLSELSEEGLAMISRIIDYYKSHREGYRTARNYILCDTDDILVTECLMDDAAIISAFVRKRRQTKIHVLPVLPHDECWYLDGEPVDEDGIYISLRPANLTANTVELKKGG